MNNPTETYNIDSHLGKNLIASAKILADKDYRENEDFNYKVDNDYWTSCYIDTVNRTISLKEIELIPDEALCKRCKVLLSADELETCATCIYELEQHAQEVQQMMQDEEPDYDWLAEVELGR